MNSYSSADQLGLSRLPLDTHSTVVMYTVTSHDIDISYDLHANHYDAIGIQSWLI